RVTAEDVGELGVDDPRLVRREEEAVDDSALEVPRQGAVAGEGALPGLAAVLAAGDSAIGAQGEPPAHELDPAELLPRQEVPGGAAVGGPEDPALGREVEDFRVGGVDGD